MYILNTIVEINKIFHARNYNLCLFFLNDSNPGFYRHRYNIYIINTLIIYFLHITPVYLYCTVLAFQQIILNLQLTQFSFLCKAFELFRPKLRNQHQIGESHQRHPVLPCPTVFSGV